MKHYKPRGDFVIFRMTDKGFVGKVAVPGISAEGKVRTIVAVGPKVENLEVGDEVLVIATEGAVGQMPGENNLYITREANVAVRVEEVEEKPESSPPDQTDCDDCYAQVLSDR